MLATAKAMDEKAIKAEEDYYDLKATFDLISTKRDQAEAQSRVATENKVAAQAALVKANGENLAA
jgi:hypothetical protein